MIALLAFLVGAALGAGVALAVTIDGLENQDERWRTAEAEVGP